MNTRTTSALTGLALAALIALTGCSTGNGDEAASDPVPASASDTLSIADTWVKAADEGMSAAFGELTNTGTAEATIVSVTSAVSNDVQLHETVENASGEMIMREMTGGFTIATGASLILEPGGNHIMLMGLTQPLKAGDEITFTLTFSDGSTLEFTAPVKDYSGANESYEDHDMDMSDH